MEKQNFSHRIYELQNEIKNAITKLVSEYQCIKIPYYYDFGANYDCDYEEEIKAYKEQGFDIQEGDISNNFTMYLYDFFGTFHYDEIIGCRLNKKNQVEILSISNKYSLSDIANICHLSDLYEMLCENVKK